MPVRKKTLTQSAPALEPEIKKAVREDGQITSLQNLRIQVSREINSLFDLLISEINNVELLKNKLQEEEKLRQREQKQQEEEQNLNLLLSQKKKEAEFEEKLEKEKKAFNEEKGKKEDELKLKKEGLDKQEEDYRKLKTQFEEFPQKLEKSVDEEKKQLAGELKKGFETEKRLLIQQYESGIKLFEQQIATLQQRIKQQDQEIQSLKNEKARAMEQINNLAVAVIKGKERDLQETS